MKLDIDLFMLLLLKEKCCCCSWSSLLFADYLNIFTRLFGGIPSNSFNDSGLQLDLDKYFYIDWVAIF